MIHNVRETGRRLKVRPTSRLRVHFLALARRVLIWRQAAGFTSESGITLGVTSAENKVGRTVVAFNLASALASLGNGPVLFVETQHSAAGFSKKVPRPGHGLSEVLEGTQSPAACICNTNIENLFVMSCGRVKEDEALELPIEALESINPDLCNTFEYVVFDLPVAEDNNLCYPIIQFLDGVMIVNQPNIRADKVQRVVKRIRELGTTIVGLVLNKA